MQKDTCQCCIHARRRFDEAIKALPKARRKDALAYLALKQIQAIYREEDKLADETAKANKLKPYDYFEYLLSEIPNHMNDKDLSFLEDLLPWSEQLPKRCRK